MASIYLHKWSSACGETFGESGPVGQTWQAGLAGVTAAQIGDGLRGCLKRTDPWPPTLPEFLQLCVPAQTNQPSPDDWKTYRADPAKMPGPKRLAWHQANVAHIKADGELPRDVYEPQVRE
jgi:hypothetical protein